MATSTRRWSASTDNDTTEYLTLGFSAPVYSLGAVIRETFGNGFVTKIEALDTSNVLHEVWPGTDTSPPDSPLGFTANWAQTAFLTVGLKIHVNTDHSLDAWEEIDAVALLGSSAVNRYLPRCRTARPRRT